MRSQKLSLLTHSLEGILAGQRSEAKEALASLAETLDVERVAEDMQYLLFAKALARRLGSGEAQRMNLYLQRFELPQISLFNLVAERLPMVRLAGEIANELLCRQLVGHEQATLIDVGLGTGRQEVALLHKLKASGAAPRRLTLVGVEPDADSLRRAEVDLSATARALGLNLRFRGIPKLVEALSDDDWGLLRDCPGPRVVHAAFALHHMAADVDRQAIFHRLRAVEPSAVVLCEPNSDHATDSAAQRFLNAWHHFSHNFALLDELDLPARERNGIKLFFGRELEDIVGTVDDARRYERHEPVETWLERLRRAGFSPAARLEGGWATPHPAVFIRSCPGYVGLGYREETLVTVLCATARAEG